MHDKHREEKFDSKTWKGIHVGYAPNGYKVYNPEIDKFSIVRDAIFDEITFITSRPVIRFEEVNSGNINNPIDLTKKN